jgi:hypothetical protein
MMLGLPLESFILVFVLPALIVAPMFYYCWLISRGLRD